jgi:hypothetical protein
MDGAWTMNANLELVSLMQQERERYIRGDRVARLAACMRACCSTSRLDRLARALRRTAAAC